MGDGINSLCSAVVPRVRMWALASGGLLPAQCKRPNIHAFMCNGYVRIDAICRKIRTNVNNIISNLLVSPNTNYTMFLLGHNNFELLTGGYVLPKPYACIAWNVCLCAVKVCASFQYLSRSLGYRSAFAAFVARPDLRIGHSPRLLLLLHCLFAGPLGHISRFMLFRTDPSHMTCAMMPVLWFIVMFSKHLFP